MTMTPRILSVVGALALIAAACSSGAEETTTTTIAPQTSTTVSSSTTTTSTSTTTTTVPEVVVADTINGLPGEEGTEQRRLVGVKVDNHPNARPQSGLQEADAVYEILVEGGLTRFIALFHQSDSRFVGPVRSARPTDSTIMRPLGGPLQISGGQDWILAIYRRDGTPLIGDNGITTYRMSHRKPPHNLYASTEAMRQYADDRAMDDDPPPPLFDFGDPTAPTEEATEITFDWSDAPDVVWKWDGEQYLRFNGATPHEWIDSDSITGQIAFDTLVVIQGERYTASPPSGSGSSVPATTTTGSGEALIFHSGGVIVGRWSRQEITDVFDVIDDDGQAIVLPPGRVWIAVFPDNRALTWE
ncbi:MAG: DUF3048 domain-containing protein [Acidimicrobiia bacterium]|nr:MAG: DUF3048 domain-containing protein [Acidimicrobiia bacterium]